MADKMNSLNLWEKILLKPKLYHMLPSDKLKTLHDLVSSSTTEELIWINGYLSGLVSDGKKFPVNGHDSLSAAPVHNLKAAVCYGTETGNAKKLAFQFTQSAKQSGITVKCANLDQYRFADLEKEPLFLAVVSTQGEGEPPESARKFFSWIFRESPDLSKVKFTILALGDSAYPLFCKAGEDLDKRLEELGATRIVPMQKCDVDYEEPAQEWFRKISAYLTGVPKQENITNIKREHKPSGKKIYAGKIQANINLNDGGSSKETYHIEISADEEIAYEPGDAIAIVPENDEFIVGRIIELARISPNEVIETPRAKDTVRQLLKKRLNICDLLSSTIKKYASLTGQEIPDTRMDLVDLVRIYPPAKPELFREILTLLPGIAPRLYSVSSSPRVHKNEVHLTVSKHSFLAQGGQRFGLCSTFLGDLPNGSPVHFYVHRNRAFKLPEPGKDMIMIGPGTGIAPFRSFLSDRDASGDNGRNWFFFGEQRFQTDFLYQAEMQQYLQTGVLQKISLAFSRDQEQKIYVQHRMLEQAAEFYDWLNNGAAVYISGTKDPMSRDVEQALLQIIEVQGKKSPAEASEYLENMKIEGSYQKDVY
jgi:sulfite reductase (NADPH) flavoprotein alpha-component